MGCRKATYKKTSKQVKVYDCDEDAVRTVVESVGYTFNVGSNGVVTVARARRCRSCAFPIAK